MFANFRPTHTRALATSLPEPKEQTASSVQSSSSPPVTNDNHRADSKPNCLIHKNFNSHTTLECNAFRRLSLDERLELVKRNQMCFKCMGDHFSRNCQSVVKCDICRGPHVTVLHRERAARFTVPQVDLSRTPPPSLHPPPPSAIPSRSQTAPSAEPQDVRLDTYTTPRALRSGFSLPRPKACSKTVPVDVRASNGISVKCFAIIDEQSNQTFVDTRLVESLSVPKEDLQDETYTMSTLSQLSPSVTGKRIINLAVKGTNRDTWLPLPPVLTHPGLPDTRDEVCTSKVLASSPIYPHTPKISFL